MKNYQDLLYNGKVWWKAQVEQTPNTLTFYRDDSNKVTKNHGYQFTESGVGYRMYDQSCSDVSKIVWKITEDVLEINGEKYKIIQLNESTLVLHEIE